MVLEKLRNRGLYAKLDKYLFHQAPIEFLGYIISGQGIYMNKKKVKNCIGVDDPNFHSRCSMFPRICEFLENFHQRLFKDCSTIDMTYWKGEIHLGQES